MQLPEDVRGRELTLLIERAKYERWVQEQTTALVDREFNRIIDVITSSKFRDLSSFQQQRALQLFRELDRQIHAGYVDITDFHTREMKGYATLESEIARAQVASTMTDGPVTSVLGSFLPKHTVQSIAALPIQGLKLGQWFDGQANTMSLQTRRIIQQGLVEGKGPLDIARKIMATDKAQGPVLVRRARNEARSISRTTVNAVQNHAAQKSYETLPEEISDSYILEAVRDARTSLICIALDGKVFRYDDPKKKVPPFHIHCRTGSRPLVKDVDQKLIDQKKSLTFRSMEDWLKAQNTATQDAVLGRARAEMWRSGKLSLADIINADNRVLSLAELRKRLGTGLPTPTAVPPAPKPIAPVQRAAPTLSDFLTGKSVVGVKGVKSGINLPGVKPDIVKEITAAFDTILSPAGIKIDGIALTNSKFAQGLYTWGRVRQEGVATYIDQIAFKKSWVNALPDPEAASRYAENRADHIARLERMIEARDTPEFRRRLADLRTPTRFSVSSTSDRPAFSTAAHEAGHALMYRSEIDREWASAVRSIPRAVKLEVSEYAAKDSAELWAEITSLVALNRSREVPAELLRIYQRIVSEIRVKP